MSMQLKPIIQQLSRVFVGEFIFSLFFEQSYLKLTTVLTRMANQCQHNHSFNNQMGHPVTIHNHIPKRVF